MDAAHDELQLTDVVLHAKQPRGGVVKAQIQHHRLHACGQGQGRSANRSHIEDEMLPRVKQHGLQVCRCWPTLVAMLSALG